MSEIERCKWDVAWVGRCKDAAVTNGLCEKHSGKVCTSCGGQAVRECEHTGIQFVCGAPLCDDCAHGAPPKDSPGWFNLGGGHVKREIAEQQWAERWAEHA